MTKDGHPSLCALKNSLIGVLLFLISTSQTLALDSLDSLDIYGGEENIEDIFERLDELDKFDRKLHQDIPEPITETPPRKSPPPGIDPRYGYLKKGQVITHGETNKRLQLPRDLFARVILTDYDSDKLWILNHDGQPTYWVYALDVVDVTPELTLTPQVPTREVFPEATRFHTTDDLFTLKHEFTYGIHSLSSSTVKSTFNPDIPNATGDIFDYTLYALWNIPFNLGWTFRYEGVSSEMDQAGGDSLSWQSFSTGPKITYELWKGERHSIEAGAEITQGFIVSGFFNEEGFEGDFLRAGLEGRFLRQYSWGHLFLSIRWINERVSIDREFFEPLAAPDLGRTSSGFVGAIGVNFNTEFSL